MNDNVVKLVIEIELLDEGFVVGVPGGGRRRLAVDAAALPGKVGLAVVDALGVAVAALTRVGVRGVPMDPPPPVDAPTLSLDVPIGPPYATAELMKGTLPEIEVAPEVVPVPVPVRQVAPPPAKPEEPAVEEPEEPDAEEAKSLSKADAERLDAVCAAVADGRVEQSSDPDNPGFYSAALVSSGVFEDISRASGFLSRAYAVGEVGRGLRSKDGFRYYVKRAIPVRTPPKPPTAEVPRPAAPAAPPAAPVAAPAPASIDLPF